MLTTEQQSPDRCDLCLEQRRTYPLTHYNRERRRWQPVRACLDCMGPGDDEYRGYLSRLDLRFPKGRAVELPE